VAETVQRFGGFVAKYMCDGVLVYFGYPQAHETSSTVRGAGRHRSHRSIRACSCRCSAAIRAFAPTNGGNLPRSSALSNRNDNGELEQAEIARKQFYGQV
jgi:class 3 adenylate cyclase